VYLVAGDVIVENITELRESNTSFFSSSRTFTINSESSSTDKNTRVVLPQQVTASTLLACNNNIVARI